MTLTKLSKVFTKETLIFSKMVDEINTKKFGIKIKNNKQISNELVFQKNLVIRNDSNYAFNSVY